MLELSFQQIKVESIMKKHLELIAKEAATETTRNNFKEKQTSQMIGYSKNNSNFDEYEEQLYLSNKYKK